MCAKLSYAPNNKFLSMVVIMQNTQEKANYLQMTKVNDTKIMRTDINFVLGKMDAIGLVV